jgi:hypothetical protein
MKIEGSIYFFPAFYDDETGEVELKDCWLVENFMWLFNVLNFIEGVICYLAGIDHYFVFKEKNI